MAKGLRKSSPIRQNVPAYITKQVGQIITKWSFLDYQLSRMLWKALDLSSEEGRLGAADRRPHEKFEAVRQLLYLKGIGIDDKDYKTILDGLRNLKDLRDQLAHGIWTLDDGTWKLINFKGNVVDQSIPKIERSRKLRPELFGVHLDKLAEVSKAITDIIGSLDTLDIVTTSQLKSPKNSGKDRN